MTASRAGIWIMKHIGSNIAALAILLISAGPLLAQEDPQFRILADGDLPVRNCTFCHGPSGQGFMVAPRLAGQRPQYIVKQLGNFIGHIRDNPFAQKYMWNAAAESHSRQGARICSLFRKPAAAGRQRWQ